MDRSGVGAGEELGRRVYSRKQAREARRARGRARLQRAFLPEGGQHVLSIDRLSIADVGHVTLLAEADAAKRDGRFQGWACLVYEIAASDGRRVVASPTEDNPYHGDIVLPTSVVTDKGERAHHARDLADASTWRDPEPDVRQSPSRVIH